jgi:hypothetical protein
MEAPATGYYRTTEPGALESSPEYQRTYQRLRAASIVESEREAYDWQLRAAATVMNGWDVFCSVKTSAGKSWAFQVAMADPANAEKMVLAISPLISLMRNQEHGLVERNIKSIAITDEALISDRELFKKLKAGEYRIGLYIPQSSMNQSTDSSAYSLHVAGENSGERVSLLESGTERCRVSPQGSIRRIR